MADPLDRPRLAEKNLFDTPTRPCVTSILIALAAGAGLFLAWRTAGTLLLIFAGLLFGALLDACTRGLALVLPVGRHWRLSIVCALFVIGISWLLILSGTNLVAQADSLIQLIGEQLRILRGELQSMGITASPNSERPRTLTQLLFPDPGALFGTAYSASTLPQVCLGAWWWLYSSACSWRSAPRPIGAAF